MQTVSDYKCQGSDLLLANPIQDDLIIFSTCSCLVPSERYLIRASLQHFVNHETSGARCYGIAAGEWDTLL